MILSHAQDHLKLAHFAHVRRHFFAGRVPSMINTVPCLLTDIICVSLGADLFLFYG